MDGNGRWAKARNKPRTFGHKVGCERIIDIYEECIVQDIKVMSVYAFSTENWNRPKDEINKLFSYLEIFFKKEIDRLEKDGSRVMVSGDITPIPEKTKKVIYSAIERTKNNNKFFLNVCLNYGGKDEIVRATKLIVKEAQEGKIKIEDINEDYFQKHLYTMDLPPVDLLIRTSGELRTSNFMPWQLAYAEFIFPKTPWPDFSKEEFRKCLDQYYLRDRRFGAIDGEEEK